MDLITLALSRKANSGSSDGTSPSYDDLIPSIGENGHWYIRGNDTGISAVPNSNVEVDGILKADTSNQKMVVVKDGTETIVGEVVTSISTDSIEQLFQEG